MRQSYQHWNQSRLLCISNMDLSFVTVVWRLCLTYSHLLSHLLCKNTFPLLLLEVT